MACRMCGERGKTWAGSDPKCAFEGSVFSGDNWNCATMNALRGRAEQLGTVFRDDLAAGSIGYVPFDGPGGSGYVVMTWYKDRGTTGNAVVLWDDEKPRPLTEEDALAALEYSARFLPSERVHEAKPGLVKAFWAAYRTALGMEDDHDTMPPGHLLAVAAGVGAVLQAAGCKAGGDVPVAGPRDAADGSSDAVHPLRGDVAKAAKTVFGVGDRGA